MPRMKKRGGLPRRPHLIRIAPGRLMHAARLPRPVYCWVDNPHLAAGFAHGWLQAQVSPAKRHLTNCRADIREAGSSVKFPAIKWPTASIDTGANLPKRCLGFKNTYSLCQIFLGQTGNAEAARKIQCIQVYVPSKAGRFYAGKLYRENTFLSYCRKIFSTHLTIKLT